MCGISPTTTQMRSHRGLDDKAFAEIPRAWSGCQECMDEGDHDMTPDADYAALVGIDWADTKHDFCLRATGSEREEYGVMGSMPDLSLRCIGTLGGRNCWVYRAERRKRFEIHRYMIYERILDTLWMCSYIRRHVLANDSTATQTRSRRHLLPARRKLLP